VSQPNPSPTKSSLWRDINRGETRIDFVGRRRLWFQISAASVLVSLLSLAIRQLNLGIEFEGGPSVTSPRLSWRMASDRRDTNAKAAEI